MSCHWNDLQDELPSTSMASQSMKPERNNKRIRQQDSKKENDIKEVMDDEWQNAVKKPKEDYESVQEERKYIYNHCKRNTQEAVAPAKANEQDKLYQSLDNIQSERQVNNNSNELENAPSNINLLGDITIKEVKTAVEDVKKDKLVQTNAILDFNVNENEYQQFTSFYCKLLHEEIIPDEWDNSDTLALHYEMGHFEDSINYEKIKIAYCFEVWENVLKRRMQKKYKISLNQFGFSPEQNLDAIYLVRLVGKRCMLLSQNLHIVCINLVQLYETVPHKYLWRAMIKKGLPAKYVRLVRALYPSNVDVGLRYKSPLNPYLLQLLMEFLTSQIEVETSSKYLVTTEHILVFCEDEKSLQKTFTIWMKKLEGIDFVINTTNTKYMVWNFNPQPSISSTILLGGMEFINDLYFNYHGSIVQSNLWFDYEISKRIWQGFSIYRMFKGKIHDPATDSKSKGNIYNLFIRPALLYGSESWSTQKSFIHRLIKIESRILKIMGSDKLSVSEIRRKFNIEDDIKGVIKKKKLEFLNYVKNKDDNYAARFMLKGIKHTRRKIGSVQLQFE